MESKQARRLKILGGYGTAEFIAQKTADFGEISLKSLGHGREY
ncbi:hypothetical protein [Holospora curviuscula]|nr:hypothetical protein [Holospora curviuscula]